MRILAIGDIFAKPGRECVREMLPRIKREHRPDIIVANAENAAHGFGVTRKVVDELFSFGIDTLTGGNHSFDNADYYDFADHEPRVLRPANYPEGAPGNGWTLVPVGATGLFVAVISLMGRAFFPNPMDCPFRTIDRILSEIPEDIVLRVVDFHAEATSEKQAMAWYLDGRISLLWGTHTHVPTADERILPRGTAYISDIGMSGVEDSVLGMRIDLSTERLRTSRPVRLEPAEGEAMLHGIVSDIDEQTGCATSIFRIAYPR